MTDARRRQACCDLRRLLDGGVPRKMALLTVRTTLRREGFPASQASIYRWCAQFKITTR